MGTIPVEPNSFCICRSGRETHPHPKLERWHHQTLPFPTLEYHTQSLGWMTRTAVWIPVMTMTCTSSTQRRAVTGCLRLPAFCSKLNGKLGKQQGSNWSDFSQVMLFLKWTFVGCHDSSNVKKRKKKLYFINAQIISWNQCAKPRRGTPFQETQNKPSALPSSELKSLTSCTGLELQ